MTVLSPSHNHQACIEQALSKATDVCNGLGARFTPQRKKILELVWQAHKPIGAYEILAKIGSKSRPAAPPTIYRALAFLLDHGLIHRISSLNAYIGCIAPEREHHGYFLLCRSCHTVLEIQNSAIDNAIFDSAVQKNFMVQGQMLEVIGLCKLCCENNKVS